MSIDFSKLRDLPVADKLRLVTQLWDDIAASTDPIVVPPDVLQEASRRSAELKADPSIAIDDDELSHHREGRRLYQFGRGVEPLVRSAGQ